MPNRENSKPSSRCPDVTCIVSQKLLTNNVICSGTYYTNRDFLMYSYTGWAKLNGVS